MLLITFLASISPPLKAIEWEKRLYCATSRLDRQATVLCARLPRFGICTMRASTWTAVWWHPIYKNARRPRATSPLPLCADTLQDSLLMILYRRR